MSVGMTLWVVSVLMTFTVWVNKSEPTLDEPAALEEPPVDELEDLDEVEDCEE